MPIFVGFLCWLLLLGWPGASLAVPAPQRETTRSPHGPLAIPCENCHTATGWRAVRADYEWSRSEEHTSELQSPDHLVCRLLLEKKKTPENTKSVPVG